MIITVIFTYIVLKNREVYAFLKKVIVNSANKYDSGMVINYKIYIFMLIAIILCGIVYWLLKYKDKPRRIYIFTILGYVIVGIFMLTVYVYIDGFSINSIDQKTIRLYRDLVMITLFFQYYIIIFMGIRGLGFDIKKFDFSKDAQELNATSLDGEEIEINTSIDTTGIMRGVRKQKRELWYFFEEYKIYILAILIFIIAVSSYKLYNYFTLKYKVYDENTLIGNIYNITVRDSYYKIDYDKNYVIINFDIYKYGTIDRLNPGNMLLIVGKDSYTPDKNICYKFNDLGNCYKKQYITNESNNYILSYAVDNLNIQDAYLIYSESYEDSYKVKLVMKEY